MKTTLEEKAEEFLKKFSPNDNAGYREHLQTEGLYNITKSLMVKFTEAAVNAKLQELELYKNAVSKNPNEEYQDWQYDKDIDLILSLQIKQQ